MHGSVTGWCPGAPPEGEDDGGGDDPQPGHAERLDECEEQHCEGRAEVVEDRAADEEALGRRGPREA